MEGDEAFDDQMDILQKMRRRQAIAERRVRGIKFVIGDKTSDPNNKVKSSLKGLRHEVVDKEAEQDEQEKEMSSVMGFAKFGHQKHVPQSSSGSNSLISSSTSSSKNLPQSRTFDIEQLVQETIMTARKTFGAAADADPAGSAAEPVPDPLPNATDSDEDDEGFVGPPLPPEMLQQSESSDPKPDASGDQDSDLSESDDEDGGDRYSRLPVISEISLQHGSKNVSALAGQ